MRVTMTERYNNGPEATHPLLVELAPDPRVYEVLTGVISEPVDTLSYKKSDAPQPVTVRLVEEGAGLFGLTDSADSKEWSGIQNHTWLSTRLALHWAAQARAAGVNINLQAMLDGGMVS